MFLQFSSLYNKQFVQTVVISVRDYTILTRLATTVKTDMCDSQTCRLFLNFFGKISESEIFDISKKKMGFLISLTLQTHQRLVDSKTPEKLGI